MYALVELCQGQFMILAVVADRALGSIYASQAGRKVMGREARDLAVASSRGDDVGYPLHG